jgi:hypothetical protein
MDRQFFSKENFLTLQNIISSFTDNDYTTQTLYQTMLRNFNENNTINDFHELNKLVINQVRESFNIFQRKNTETNINQLNDTITDSQLIRDRNDRFENDKNENDKNDKNDGDVNELFSTLSNDRNYNIRNGDIGRDVGGNGGGDTNSIHNSIHNDIEDMIKNGNSLNISSYDDMSGNANLFNLDNDEQSDNEEDMKHQYHENIKEQYRNEQFTKNKFNDDMNDMNDMNQYSGNDDMNDMNQYSGNDDMNDMNQYSNKGYRRDIEDDTIPFNQETSGDRFNNQETRNRLNDSDNINPFNKQIDINHFDGNNTQDIIPFNDEDDMFNNLDKVTSIGDSGRQDIIDQERKINTPFKIGTTNNFSHPYLEIPRKHKQVEKDIIVVIDSKDRDLHLYPNSNHFQVKFGGNSDSIEIPTHINSDGTITHEVATLFKGYTGAQINSTMKNIKEIQLINVIVPYTPIYYNGNCPTKFNNDNQKITSNNNWDGTKGVLSGAYEPLYDEGGPSGTGIPIDVLSEPYLLIDVDEIDTQHYFRSTNVENERAFARVINDKIFGSSLQSSYVIFTTYSPEEKMTFDPTLLSSIDKMTLHVRNQSNTHVNFGQDKTYTSNLSEYTVTPIQNRCNGNNITNGTQITITTKHNDYIQEDCAHDTISGHCLSPGDIIYLYDTRPCRTEHIFQLNKDQVTGTYSLSGSIHLFEIKFKSVPVKKGDKIATRILELSNYLLTGDYISISGNLYKVIGFSKRKAILSSNDFDRNNLVIGTFKDIGFVRQNKRGFIDDNACSINYKGGYRVCYIIDSTNFVIDYPYESLTTHLKNNYEGDSVFFIKKYMQVNYMFKFKIVEKDYEELKSDIV